MTRKAVVLLTALTLTALLAVAGTAAAEPAPPGSLQLQACFRIWNFGHDTYAEWRMEDQLAQTGDAEAAARAEDLAEDLEIAEQRYDDKGCTEVTGDWPWDPDEYE